MHAKIWVVSTLLISIVLIVLPIVKFKFHPFLASLPASCFAGPMIVLGRLESVPALVAGIVGLPGFLARAFRASTVHV